MSTIPSELLYTSSHEWLRQNDDGTVTVGITDYAQSQLGDLVFVEPPEVGRMVAAEENCAVVESVKSASDVYSPVAGEIVAANTTLADQPEQVNADPYGAGWLFTVRLDGALDGFMDAAAYQAHLDSLE